jgi:hypothetical protein
MTIASIARLFEKVVGLLTRHISANFARRLCASRLTWKEKADILDMPLSTVQRHYGVHKS